MTIQEKILSFHGDQKIKDNYVNRVKLHLKMDEVVKCKNWKNTKGFAIVCTVNSNSHDVYMAELGISWRLSLLEDYLFESLPNDQAKLFSLQFLKSMPIGVNTDLIYKKFLLWNLADKKEGLIYHVKDEKQILLLKEVVTLHEKSMTEEIPEEIWKELSDRAIHLALDFSIVGDYHPAYIYKSASDTACFKHNFASTFSDCPYHSTPALVCTCAFASAFAPEKWQEKFDERIIKMRDVLLKLMIEAKH